MQLEKHINQLKDPSPLVRLEAICAISRAGKGAVEPLLAVLSDPALPPYTRAGAAKALGAIGDHRSRLPLEKALSEDDIVVRIPAAMALARMKSKSSVPALLGALGHESGIMRKYAEDAVVSIIRSCKTPENIETVKGFIGESIDQKGPSKALSRLSREISYVSRRLMGIDTSGLTANAPQHKKVAASTSPIHSKVC
jgi:HEAT repeat protein